MASLFEKLKRTLDHYFLRLTTDWTFPSNVAYLTANKMARGNYEPQVSRLIADYLTNGDIFLDVGANIGYFSRLAHDVVGKNGKVYAFEAEHNNFSALTKNTKSCVNVIPVNLAASDKNSFINVKHSSHSSCHSILDTDIYLDGTEFRVPAITIDHFWYHFLEKKHIRLIKLDVEGAELLVLNGMQNVLDQKSVDILIIEFCPRLIVNAGFKPENFYNKLSPYFSISIIENEYRNEVTYRQLKNLSEFNSFSDHLLNSDDVQYSNLLCKWPD